jgi:hypothetical protein
MAAQAVFSQPAGAASPGSEVAVSQTLEDGLAASAPGFVLERDQPDQQQRELIQP